MKKTIFVMLLIAVSHCGAFAQVNVDANGRVSIGTNPPIANTALNVGASYYSGYRHAVNALISAENNYITNTAICATVAANMSFNGGRSIGVSGIAGKYTSGYNYGVLGGVPSGTFGAGIFGTTGNYAGVYVNGLYAGYFDGPTYCNNTVTANSFVTLSDIRLKENISPISASTAEGSTLKNVMDMNVISYQYKNREIPEAERDTISAEQAEAKYAVSKNLHYGLSAQELQKIYPDLVYEGQDGYLGVNYVELVPILIRSIQELKQELDMVKSQTSIAARQSGEESTDIRLSFQKSSKQGPATDAYAIQGHRIGVSSSGKGVYVQNGKKVLGN